MSYNGIGLSSAKGSSTSGHIQRSLYQQQNGRTKGKLYESRKDKEDRKNRVNKYHKRANMTVDKDISKHLDDRELEVMVAERRDWLEEEYPEKDDDEIDLMEDAYRRVLKAKKQSFEEKHRKQQQREARIAEEGEIGEKELIEEKEEVGEKEEIDQVGIEGIEDNYTVGKEEVTDIDDNLKQKN